ncbi:MAG TPA: DUF4012 domain-containing protein [Acidimicrobiales bacterium]
MSLAATRRPLFATRRSRTYAFGAAIVASGLGAAVLTTAHPTGFDTADAFWSLALAAVVATFGATARRWTWFLPAGAAAVLGGDRVAVICAAAAIAIAFVSVLRDTRSRARGALVCGLGMIALLRVGPVGFHGLSALVTVVAILPILVSGYNHAGRRVQARTRKVALIAGGVIGLMVAGAVLALISVQDSLADGVRAVDGGLDAARQADDDTAAQQLGLAARSLATADSTLSSWFAAPARTLPIIGPNLSAVGELSHQASDVANVTSLAASQADVDTLRFVGGRLDPAAVEKMAAPLVQVKLSLDRMEASVEDVRSPWLFHPVVTRIDRLDDQIADAQPEADAAITAVDVGPKLLGAGGSARYLVLFTTPVEARGRTGFPGNYAELVVTDGKLSMPRFGRISELEHGGLPPGQRSIPWPEDYVARYSRFDVADTWRNLTMSPDFVAIAFAANHLYPQSGGEQLDGVLSVDPVGLAGLMRFTGPIDVPGLPAQLTADNTAKFLELDQYLLYADQTQRTDLLETVARTTFDRLTSADLPGPRRISEVLDPIVDGGHIQFSPIDTDTQLKLLDTGVTGAMPIPDGGDLVTLTTANAGASKIDLFLKRHEQYTAHWNPETGQVDSTIKVTLENTAPADGLPDYVIGNAVDLPRGTNRSFVSIYSPFELAASRVGGQPTPVQSEMEVGYHVYSTFVDIPPGQSIDIELDLTGSVKGHSYRLNMPVQPFATADDMTVTVQTTDGQAVVSRQAGVSDDTASWQTTLDRSRSLTVAAPR